MNRRIVTAGMWLCAILATGGMNLPAPAEAQDQAASRFEQVIADLRENSMSAEEIRTTEQIERFEVVNVDDIVEGGEIEALQKTLRGTEDGFAEVQTAIVANERFEAEIERRSIELRHVFAVTNSGEGEVTIYVGPTRPIP